MDKEFVFFLKKLLLDTISINLNYLESPYTDIHNVDIGLRKGLKNSKELYSNLQQILEHIDHECFYFYSDPYFLNYIFFHPTDSEDVICIGPYLKAKVNNDFLNKLTENHHLKYSEMESIRAFLYELIVITDHIRLVSILVDIIDYISPNSTFTTKTYNMREEEADNIIYTPIDDFMLKAQATEKRYQLEDQLSFAISKGDINAALSITRHFMSMLYEPRIADNLSNVKASLFSTNTTLRIGAGQSNVHPIFLHELSGKFVKLIHSATTINELNTLHEKMIREYCLLVQNKSRLSYSSLISNVLNYIDFNLSQKLTLTLLADYFHVSAPHLSKTFKKEVKSTIIDYINSKRIHESLKLLTTTDMSIQDIASYVGIYDFNYYSKLFKKYIGLSPRKYRKNLK